MVNNILIIGITGNGKSALANTLSDASNDNKFGEGNAAISQTTDSRKSEKFSWKGKEYCLIDNIGFGDNRDISEEDILLKIGEGIHSAKEGINQILFVFKGRFGPEHVLAFNKFKTFISESKITDYTTLVRTSFPNFEEKEDCDKDREDLLRQNKELAEIIGSCKGGIIYVDNPSVSISDEEEKQLNQEIREASREIVLNHLAENCLEVYKFREWNSIHKLVGDYIIEKEKTKEADLGKLKNEVTEKIKVHLAKELPVAAFEYSKQNP